MPQIDIRKRAEVLTMWREGKSQSFISRQLEISRCAVQHIIKKCKCHKSKENMPRSGRPRKMSSKDERKLVRLSKCHPKWPASYLLKECNSIGEPSLSTAKRILRKYGLYGRTAAKKPHLNRKHVNDRLKWCREYQNWDPEMWSNVIFSDETQIKLFPNTREYVRRPKGKRFSEEYTTKTKKFGGQSIIVWGAVKSNGDRKLIRSLGTIHSTEYQRILEHGLLPLLDAKTIFQHDGAPSHRSKSTEEWLAKKNICVLSDWPPLSPDLNIMENIWSEIKRNLAMRQIKTKDELWQACEEEWKKFPQSKIRNLYSSMPRRTNAIIKSRGYPSKY